MAQTGLFEDAALARLLDAHPRAPDALKPVCWAASKALRPLAPKTDALKSHGRGFDVNLAAPGCIAWREGWSLDGRTALKG